MKRLIRASADTALVLDNENEFTTASQIALNLKGEWDAIEGYQKLIPFFQMHGDDEAVDQIKEIISDELNHAQVLRELMKEYDGGIETAED